MSDSCPFCDRLEIAYRIIWEDEIFFLFATLGQITKDGGYVVLATKAHIPCMGAIPKDQVERLDATQEKIRQAIKKEYGILPLFFEHGIKGQSVLHAHIHAIPTSFDPGSQIAMDFPNTCIKVVRSFAELRFDYICRQRPYLYWQPQGSKLRFACWDPDTPPQYLRKVVAKGIRRPAYGDWKETRSNEDKKAADDAMIASTVTRLKKYFA